jgi:cell division transport system ATP-binding protein
MPHELSGGEQQRIVIARAILNHPTLLLADEPTGNLDNETGTFIMQLLHNICKEEKTAVLMITHNEQWLTTFPGIEFLCKDKKLIENKKATPETEEEVEEVQTDETPAEEVQTEELEEAVAIESTAEETIE